MIPGKLDAEETSHQWMNFQTSIICRRLFSGRRAPCVAKMWARQMPVVVAITKAILDGTYNGHVAQSTWDLFGIHLTGLEEDFYQL